jgi:acyl carrier protein
VLEYVGRIDEQVKVRGYRIELGEIEAVLRRHEKVRDALVIAREERAGNKILAAYIVPESKDELAVAELRSLLETSLPNYMMPSTWMMLDHLPLTLNGKVDRKALPVPVSDRSVRSRIDAIPQTELEQTIANIWQTVLQIDSVGLDDNFFDLGAHSLLLVEAQTGLESALKIKIELMDLFKYTTVRSLAKFFGELDIEKTKEPREERADLRKRFGGQQRESRLARRATPA